MKWAYGGDADQDVLIPALADVFANHPMDEIAVWVNGELRALMPLGPTCDPIFGCGD